MTSADAARASVHHEVDGVGGRRPARRAKAEVHDEQARSAQLGAAIRTLRRRNDLTLVQLAAKVSLSHSFLSQLERGEARPSMSSLHRIAVALGTTQQALMSFQVGEAQGGPVCMVSGGEGDSVAHQGGSARSLVRGERKMHPVEYVNPNTEFDEFYTHDSDEFIYVIEGVIEVDLEGEGLYRLVAGDTLYYAGGIPHRWRSLTSDPVKLLMVQENQVPTY
jgi:mannose-6-phosphate isomerase-like protein (cupin superfamily)/DNA-binding transcriptional regulator YiaG